MENRHKINLDFKQRSFSNINFVQNNIDTGVLEITITDGGQVVNVTGQTVSFAFLKADQTLVIQDSTTGVSIVDGPNGKIQCILKSNSIAAVGIVKAEVSFSLDGKKLSTGTFNFTVSSSIDNGAGLLSTNEIALIDAKIVEATNALTAMNANEGSRSSAEVTRLASESIRVTNEQGRVAAESERVLEESGRVSAEIIRVDSEDTRITTETSRNTAEIARNSSESARFTSETSRVSVESARVGAEASRASAESTRVTNEATRISQEANRQGTYNTGILIWQTPVANFAALASTYPAPSAGWCAQTLDNNQWYRYSGTTWEYKGNFSITGAATVVSLNDIDKAKAYIVRNQKHSGVVNYLPITTGSTANLNSITIPETTYSVNGYEIKMPLTVLTFPTAPTTETWDDSVFLETYFPATGNGYTMAGRYRTVSNVNFKDFVNGLEPRGGSPLVTNYAVQAQGGNAAPLSYVDSWTATGNFTQYGAFYDRLSRTTTSIVEKIIYLDDVGIYIAGKGDTASKAALATFDGYSYAIPLFRVKRRNSSGFSPSNPNGAKDYRSASFTCSATVAQGQNTQLTTSDTSWLSIGQILANAGNNVLVWKIVSIDSGTTLTATEIYSGGQTPASQNYYAKSDRPDSLYANVIDARDIPPTYDLRHRVQTQFNYDYELRKASDQFMRGELSPKKLMTVRHGISKTEIDANTVFYASLDGTTVAEVGTTTLANISSPSYKLTPTGSGLSIPNAGNISFPISGLTEFTFDACFSTDDLFLVGTNTKDILRITDGTNNITLAKRVTTNDFSIYKGDGTYLTITVAKPSGKFTFVRFKGSNGTMKIYFNGVEVYSGAYVNLELMTSANVGRTTSLYGYIGTVSDVSFSNIDRGSLFPNLPADFISGDAHIMPAYTDQRRILSEAQMTQTVNGTVKIGTTGSNRGLATSRASGSWTSGDTITVTGMAGELISGIMDTDTALANVIKDITSSNVIPLDDVTKIEVGDIIQLYNTSQNIVSVVRNVTGKDITAKTITIDGSPISLTLAQRFIIIETTASSSVPLINFMNVATKTAVAGTWATLGTNIATFTLGTNAGLVAQDIQIDHSLIIPAGQPALIAPTTTTLGGEAGFRIPYANQTITSDYVGKVSGRTWENCNIAKTLSGIVANNPAPSTFVNELVTSEYAKIGAQDGTVTTFSTSVNGEQACVLLSFDLIKIAERKLGCKIPAKDLAGKVAWLGANKNLISFIVWMYGSSPTGNKATIKVYKIPDNIWSSTNATNTSSSPTKIQFDYGYVDSNGFGNAIVYADPSDGVTPSTINVDFSSLDIIFASKVINSYKLVNGTVAVRDDFVGKIAGSVVENGNITKGHTIIDNPTMGTEFSIVQYADISTLNGTLKGTSTSTAGNQGCHIFSFNLIRETEDKYGPIPAIDKVQWLKDNLSDIGLFKWWGYGSGPTGNKATLAVFQLNDNMWHGAITTTASTVTSLSRNGSIPYIVDANGFIHFLAYADASDGVTASTIYTDYCNIELTFKSLIGYDQLVPENPRRDAGVASILFVRKETKEVQSLFPIATDLNLVTYSDYLEAPTPISANTDVTILAEIPEFLITDLGSAVGDKQGIHHWMNLAYRVGQDNDNLYGELGFSSVPFAPDNIGNNVGAKINVSSVGFNSNYALVRGLLVIPKPLVHIGRWLVLVDGELKLFVVSKYTVDGMSSVSGSPTGFLLSIKGKPLVKEIDGVVRTYLNPTTWRTSTLIVQGFVDKATNKLITTNNSI